MTRVTPAQAGKKNISRLQRWALALERMIEAQKLLDESGAPIEIGAELDLAIEHLKGEIARVEASDCP